MDPREILIVVTRQKALIEELERISKADFSNSPPQYKIELCEHINTICEQFQLNYSQIEFFVRPGGPHIGNTIDKVKKLCEDLKKQLFQAESATEKEQGQKCKLELKQHEVASLPVVNQPIQLQRLNNLQKQMDLIITTIKQFEGTFEEYTRHVYENQKRILYEKLNKITELHEEFMSNATEEELSCPYVINGEYDDIKRAVSCYLLRSVLRVTQNNRKACPQNQPPVKLPTFRGDYLQWRSFYELFLMVIDNKSSLDPKEKLILLKAHLEGEPLQLIQNLKTSNLNYKLSLDILKARYENERIIFSIHIENLLSIANRTIQSAASIKSLMDSVVNELGEIRSMGIRVSSWGPLIVHLILKALDPESRNLFEITLTDPAKIPSLRTLFNFLSRRHGSLDVMPSTSQCRDNTNHETETIYRCIEDPTLTLIPTAIVRVSKSISHGLGIQVRALVDQGSQASLITEGVAKALNLEQEKVFIDLIGVGGITSETIRGKVNITISPCFSSKFKLEANVLVSTKLRKTLPPQLIQDKDVKPFKNLQLADTTFNIPGSIDMIIGADLYAEIIVNGLTRGTNNSLVGQKSKLGWIIYGKVMNSTAK